MRVKAAPVVVKIALRLDLVCVKGGALVVITQHENALLIEREPRWDGVLLYLQQVQNLLNEPVTNVTVLCFGIVRKQLRILDISFMRPQGVA